VLCVNSVDRTNSVDFTNSVDDTICKSDFRRNFRFDFFSNSVDCTNSVDCSVNVDWLDFVSQKIFKIFFQKHFFKKKFS